MKNDERPAPVGLRFVQSAASVVLVPSVANPKTRRPKSGKQLEFERRLEDPEFAALPGKDQAKEMGVNPSTVTRWKQNIEGSGEPEDPGVL